MSLVELAEARALWVWRYLRTAREGYSADERAAAWMLQHSTEALATDLQLLKAAVLRVERKKEQAA